MVFELKWFDIFDSFSLVQPIRLFEIITSVLQESVQHADDTAVHFGVKVCFENRKYCAKNLTDSLL